MSSTLVAWSRVSALSAFPDTKGLSRTTEDAVCPRLVDETAEEAGHAHAVQ